MSVVMYIANKSTDGEKLELQVHPNAGGTDTVTLEADQAYVVRDMTETHHFEAQPWSPGVEVNVVSVESLESTTAEVSPDSGDQVDPRDLDPNFTDGDGTNGD